MSAMPIGIPGWPDFAFSTASIASARKASAIWRSFGSRGAGRGGEVSFMFWEDGGWPEEDKGGQDPPGPESFRFDNLKLSCMHLLFLFYQDWIKKNSRSGCKLGSVPAEPNPRVSGRGSST